MKKDLKQLLETLNITDENKIAVANYLQEQIKAIKAECYEDFAKKYEADNEKTMNALNLVTNDVIKEEKTKLNVHRKKLIEEKLAIQKERDNLNKELADRTAIIKEEFSKKYNDAKKALVEKNAKSFNDMVLKVQSFINENVKKEVMDLRSTKRKLSEAIDQFGSFVAEQTQKCVALHRNEARKFDALKVRLVKENAQQMAKTKKAFFIETAKKVQDYVNNQMQVELREFREDLINARKNDFGLKIFETFKNEFKKSYFNEDKVAKGLLESVTKKVNTLKKTINKLDSEKNNLLAENKNLSAVKEKLLRDKIINESISFLSAEKQSMIKNLLTGCKTSELKESIKKYLPAILDEKSKSKINKNEGILLKENKTILTGDEKRKPSMTLEDRLDPEIEAEIAEISSSAKF